MSQYIVQDVFSSGLPGPGFTVHQTREEAEEEQQVRFDTSTTVPYRECLTCGSILGLDRQPLQGGCQECR
jgi:hypothetical protein